MSRHLRRDLGGVGRAAGDPAWRWTEWAAALLQEEPNLDYAVAALARAYRLPSGAPLILFALGRTTGWIAHAIEEYAAGELIRPRARYTGPKPPEPANRKA